MELLHSSKVRQRNVNKPIEEIIVHGREGYEDIKEDNGRKGSQRRIAWGWAIQNGVSEEVKYELTPPWFNVT